MGEHGLNGNGVVRAGGAALVPAPAGMPAIAWPRTDRPLRVAIMGWARLSAQALEGSGYNLSASELARGLVLCGHEVSYLQSGMNYRVYGGPRVRERETWAGIRCYDLVNAPNLSPSAHNFLNTETEIRSPETTRLVLGWLDAVRAQVVHIHSLEGYGLDVIAAIRASGRPVVVTPHNYAYVCPQVDLLHEETRVCEDYRGGERCVGCLKAHPPAKAKRKRAIGQTLERWLGPFRADVVRKAIYGLVPTVKGVLRGEEFRPWDAPIPNPDRHADPELAAGFDGAGPGRGDGLVRHDLPLKPDERPRPFEATPADQNERMLRGPDGRGVDHHLTVLNTYGRRRVAGVEALNAASLVTSPSDFLRRVHVAMGVREEATRWVRLGQPHFDQINRTARRSPYYDVSPWMPRERRPDRPLRLAFFGTTRPNKGLEVLTQAIPLLSRDVRERCQFIIRAHGNDLAFRKRLSHYPQVAVSGGFDLYQLIGAGGEYDIGLLPHIWLENSPLVMLEHLHAGKFVISSRLGGPVDWIDPPRNGLLFAAGRPDELAECIRQVVVGDVRVPSPREVHEATVLRSYPDHVREVEGIYHELLGADLPTGDNPPGRSPGRAVAGATA